MFLFTILFCNSLTVFARTKETPNMDVASIRPTEIILGNIYVLLTFIFCYDSKDVAYSSLFKVSSLPRISASVNGSGDLSFPESA